MAIQAIKPTEVKGQKRNYSNVVTAAAGAATGVVARYIMPTKAELSKAINKDVVDTFTNSAAIAARSAKRSAAKYGVLGAFFALSAKALYEIFRGNNNNRAQEYSKLGALIDAPDYACEMLWYND